MKQTCTCTDRIIVLSLLLLSMWIPKVQAFAQHNGQKQRTEPLADPQITSSPVVEALAGKPYAYTVVAQGTTPLTFSLPEKPPAMSVQSTRGVIGWWPERTHMGVHHVRVVVSNSVGTAEQEYDLEVYASPQLSSIPDLPVDAGSELRYQVSAEARPDPAYSVSEGPDGLAIDAASGMLTWSPTEEDVGFHLVKITANNRFGTAEKSFSVDVRSTLNAGVLPAVRDFSILSPYPVPAGEVVRIPVVADRSMVLRYELYCILGMLLRCGRMDVAGNTTDILALRTVDLQPGWYFLRLRNGTLTKHARFDVMR
jgi:hypothetical protein